MKQIYLDNAASTEIDKEVLKVLKKFSENVYGNPSSIHSQGQKAKTEIETARKVFASKINSKPEEIYFTSGATESNNFVLKGLFFQNFPKKNHIVTSKIEHDSILKTCKWLKKHGAKVTYLDVDSEGFINLNELKRAITRTTFLVSIMSTNNEVGTIQNLEEIGKICKEKNVLFHTDATQSFTKTPIDVKKLNLSLLSASSHKINGPKGVGFVYIKEGTEIEPLLHGGGHEHGLRSGTENVPAIVGFAKAVEISQKIDYKKMENLRNKLMNGILETISKTKLNGPKENRLANNVNISFEECEGEALGEYLNAKGVFVSTGSACMSNTHSGSHVLKALGKTAQEAVSAIRLTLGKNTTEKDINYVLSILPEIVNRLRKGGDLGNSRKYEDFCFGKTDEK